MTSNDIGLSALEAIDRQESLAVKSALKATLGRELAEEASTPAAGIGAAATPQHMASPGRLQHKRPHAAGEPRR